MRDARIHTSLAWTPSAVTDDEIERLLSMSLAQQEKYYDRYGLVVLPTRGKVKGLPRLIQMEADAWARVRFGKREQRA